MTPLLDYLVLAATAWFLGFFPFFEIYVAVPAALALGLDPVSAVLWPVLGNFLPVPLILYGYERLARLGRIGEWLASRRSARFERLINRYGTPFVLLVTPWIGVWVVAATARLLGMDHRLLLAYTFVSIVLYAVVLAAGILLGLGAFS